MPPVADTGDPDALAFPGATVRRTSVSSQLDVLAVLQLAASGRLRCSEKTRRPSAASVTAVAAALAEGDFAADDAIAAFAWPLLLQAGGLVELAGGRLQLTQRGRRALGAPPADTIALLWKRWLTAGVVDEMSRIDTIRGQGSARALTALAPRRRAVGAALAKVPPGEWLGVDELFALVRRQTTRSFVVARDVWKLYLLEPRYGSLGFDGHHNWSMLEGRYLLCLLFEYAGTLGLFDLAYVDPAGARDDFRHCWGADELAQLTRYDGLLAVRMNNLGAYAFGLAGAFEPDPMTELTQFLSDHSGELLPPGVVTLLDDVGRRASPVSSLGVVHLVVCADEALAVLISSDRTLRRMCSRVGARHLAVPVELEPEFNMGLQKLGYVIGGTGRT